MKNLLLGLLAIFTMIVSGCNKNELNIFKEESGRAAEVITGYDFDLAMRPLPASIRKYFSVDIQLRIIPQGIEASTKYTISFIQLEGNGTLEDEEGNYLSQNIFYDLKNKSFTLKYTSYSDTDHYFVLTIKDNFGNVIKQRIKLMPDIEIPQAK